MDEERWVLVVGGYYFVSEFKPDIVADAYIFNSGCTRYQSLMHLKSGKAGHPCGTGTEVSPGMESVQLLHNPNFTADALY